tara:strand:- start:2607 stop:2903 length:297 start_codon:yes stop_codon:yes gene_type:complete
MSSNDICTYRFKRGDKKGLVCGIKGNWMSGGCEYKYLCKVHERQVTKSSMKGVIEPKEQDMSVILDDEDYWDEHIWIPPKAPAGSSDDVFWCPDRVIF